MMSIDPPLRSAPPAQEQPGQPGRESALDPPARHEHPERRGSGRLRDRVALVTGGDSGIGRAVAAAFAREGADVVIGYLPVEQEDAAATAELVEGHGRSILLVPGDLADEGACEDLVARAVGRFGRLDVLVSNAGRQEVRQDLTEISDAQLRRTFETNVYPAFGLARAALPVLEQGASIIVTTSVTAFDGHPALVDYAASKGALVAFTRALATQVAERGIRVNAVAPGPIWTPLIPATFEPEHVAEFGQSVPLGRPGQPFEVAETYVFLASDDSTFYTGQILHPNGGSPV